MTISHIDGFDIYTDNTDFIDSYTIASAPVWGAATGRFGGAAVVVNFYTECFSITAPLAHSYIAMGTAFKSTMDTSQTGLMSSRQELVGSSSDNNAAVSVKSDGSLMLQGGSVTLGTSITGLVAPSTWYYLELVFFRDATVGWAKVYLNGTEVVNVTGADFSSSLAGSYASWGGWNNTENGAITYFDDVYFASSETDTLSPLGDVVIGVSDADGDTAQADFTGTYTDVQVDDGDTTVISSSTLGHKSEFTIADMPASTTVHAVCVASRSSKSAAGSIELTSYIDSGGTEAAGLPVLPSESGYTLQRDTFDKDPATAVAWTEAGVNSVKIGVEVTA